MKNIKIQKFKNFFEVGVVLFTLKAFLDSSSIFSIGTIGDVILVTIAVISMILSIINQRYSLKILLIYFILTIISLYTTIITGQSVIIITVITCLALRKYDLNETIKKIYKLSKFLLIFQIICFFVLVLANQLPLSTTTYDGRIRMSLGFVHANSFAIYFFNLLLMWVWLNYSKIKKKNIIQMLLLSFICFLLTNSKTSFIISIIFSLLLYIIKFTKFPKKIVNLVAKTIFPAISLIFIYLITQYLKGNEIAFKISELLTGRIKLGAYAYNYYGLSFLGQNIEFGRITWDSIWMLTSFTFDSVYSTLLINWGWFWIIILSFLFFKLGNKKNKKINLFLIMWALYAITEVHGLNAYLCFPILLLTLLFDKKYKKLNEE